MSDNIAVVTVLYGDTYRCQNYVSLRLKGIANFTYYK